MKTFRITSLAGTTAVVLAALGLVAQRATAQSIASRVARVSNGTVRMTFAARPGICGSGNSIRHSNGRGRTTWGDNWNYSPDVEWETDCSHGPARVVIDKQHGAVDQIVIGTIEPFEHLLFLGRKIRDDAMQEQRGFIEQPLRRFDALHHDAARDGVKLSVFLGR